jgi:thiol-disulfide isomerase/thioredoxin
MKRFIIFYLFIIVTITLFPKQHNKTSNTNITTEHAAVAVQESCGFSINKIACSFTLKNQFGKNIKLHDLIGKVVVLDFSTMWCYPCNVAAMSSRDIQKKYGDDIAYITIIAQDEEGKRPTKKKLVKWAKRFWITAPYVLAADDKIFMSKKRQGWDINAWPTFVIIDRKMKIVDYFEGFSEKYVEKKIEENL